MAHGLHHIGYADGLCGFWGESHPGDPHLNVLRCIQGDQRQHWIGEHRHVITNEPERGCYSGGKFRLVVHHDHAGGAFRRQGGGERRSVTAGDFPASGDAIR